MIVLSWAIWGLLFYIFFFEGCEKNFICSNWLLSSRLCLEFISTILAAGLFLRPHKSCELEVLGGNHGQHVVTGTFHKEAALIHAQL